MAGNIKHESLLQIVDNIAREKGIDREELIITVEHAIQKASKDLYGLENDIRATINRNSGEIKLVRCITVAEEVQNSYTEIDLESALKYDTSLKIGDIISEGLPSLKSYRGAIQAAKQLIMQRLREVERLRQFEHFKDRIGDIVTGTVKRSDLRNVIIEVDKTEAFLPRSELIPGEGFRDGDRVKSYIFDVKLSPKGPQILLSRTHPLFLKKLFANEVMEINEGVIDIIAVSRDPGSRAKIAVTSYNPNVDPVGACVGVRGTRVQSITNELQGEKIDIILWSENPAVFVPNALAPAEVSRMVIDEEKTLIRVVVPDHHYSAAIGRRGQNVKLASQLTGWHLDIISDTEEARQRTEAIEKQTAELMGALDVEEGLAQILVSEGFTNVEEIAFVAAEELMSIEEFDKDLVEELQERAKKYLEDQSAANLERFYSLGGTQELAEFCDMPSQMLLRLAENNVFSVNDLGDLDVQELLEFLGELGLQLEPASKLIMAARQTWFENRAPGR